MTVHAVRMRRERDEEVDYCYIYQRDGDLFHAHNNASGWSESKFTLQTVDHHLTMYRKDRFYATKTDIPDFVRERMEAAADE